MSVAKRAVTVPLPRLVHGTLPRCRAPEHVAVVDEVPMLIPVLSGAEAPMVLRQPQPQVPGREHESGTYRLHAGGYLRPVEYGRSLGGCEPGAFGPALLDRVGRSLGLPARDAAHRDELADWGRLLGGANRRRGLVPAADARFASVDDDGRAAQAALAAHVQAHLVLVDGRLHHRAPAPGYRVLTGSGPNPSVSVAALATATVPFGARPARPEWSTTFGPHRRADAVAMADALARATEGAIRVGDGQAFDVWAMGAVEAAEPEPSPGEALARAGMDLAVATRGCAGHLDDDGLSLYAALRSGRAGDGPDGILDAMRRLAGAVEAARDAAGGEYMPEHEAKAFAASLSAWRRIGLRVDLFEGPRWGLADPDMDAMAGLSAGP